MGNFLYALIIGCGILLVLVILGRYFRNNEEAAKDIEDSFHAIHDAIGVLVIGLLFCLTIFFYVIEIQNVGPYLDAHLTMVNGEAVLLGFSIFSIIAVSAGTFTAYGVTKDDGKVLPYEWFQVFFFFALAVAVEYMFYSYGYKVHVEYYSKNIEVWNNALNNLENPILGYSKDQIIIEARKITAHLRNLEMESWKGIERMNMLLYQIVFNLFCIISTTFGTAKYNAAKVSKLLKKKEEEEEKEADKGGSDPPFKSIMEDPFS